MNNKRGFVFELLVFGALLAVAVLSRFWLADIPNFKPVAAIALLSGFLFRRIELAFALPLLVMFVSDFQIGSYEMPIMLAVYGSLALCPLMGWTAAKLVKAKGWGRVGQTGVVFSSAILMSIVFFTVTNLAVWTQWYEINGSGLLACFVAALPFFKYTLISNVGFSLTCLAGFWAVGDLVVRVQPKESEQAELQSAK